MNDDITDREMRERAYALAHELERRRSDDPIRTFIPHPRQRDFIDSCLTGRYKENWFVAANRSGKSDAGAIVGASFARYGMAPKRAQAKGSSIEVYDRATSGWVSALDFPTARDVIQPKYFDNGFVPAGQFHPPFIPKHEISEWRQQDQILKLKNGSIIGFKSADSGRKKYQGAEKDWFHMDEEHPWEIYEEAVIRVGARPLHFFCTATILPPEGISTGSASWVFSKIISPFQDGRLTHLGVFGASIYDNPGININEIRRLESIYPEGTVQRRIRMNGEWLPGIGGARAYAAFDRTIHVREQPELSLRRPLIWTWDFNVEPMCSLVGQRDGAIFRVYRELVLSEGNISEMCEMFVNAFPSHGAEIWLYGDATGNKRTGQTGRSDYFIILNEMKSYGVPIKMRIPTENPKVPDRVNAVNRVCRDEEGSVRLSIDPSCQELALDLEAVMRDNRGGIMKTYNRKDPYFHRTHTSDALGYWIGFDEPVRPPSDHVRRNIKIPRPSYGGGGTNA